MKKEDLLKENGRLETLILEVRENEMKKYRENEQLKQKCQELEQELKCVKNEEVKILIDIIYGIITKTNTNIERRSLEHKIFKGGLRR